MKAIFIIGDSRIASSMETIMLGKGTTTCMVRAVFPEMGAFLVHRYIL